jgi:hypothetical protein
MTATNSDFPKFINPQIENVYKYGIGIPEEILSEILQLPRQELISDLELVLHDAIVRYNYFNELGWEEEKTHFPLHAIFILMELNATESLQKIFHFLESDDDFLEFWLGDHITETIWQCFYKLGFHNTVPLKEFLMKPGINTYCKTSVAEALTQIALRNQERKDEIENLYTEVLLYFLKLTDPNIINDIDRDYIALLIWSIVDCRYTKLLPLIKELFNKSYVNPGVVGTYKSVEESMYSAYKYYDRKENFNIFLLYKHVHDTWHGYKPEGYNKQLDRMELPDYEQQNTTSQSSKKIGRNEACPCGSGKKYKKCCLNN